MYGKSREKAEVRQHPTLCHLVSLGEHGGIALTPQKSEKAEARREKATLSRLTSHLSYVLPLYGINSTFPVVCRPSRRVWASAAFARGCSSPIRTLSAPS